MLGYKRHSEFRKHLLQALAVDKATLFNLPSIIISDRNVAVLEDGLPWSSSRAVESLPILSTHVGIPPIYFLLEAIWTRIRLRQDLVEQLHGDTIALPRFRPLLSMAWTDGQIDPTVHKDEGDSTSDSDEFQWAPTELDDETNEPMHFQFLHTPEVAKLMREVAAGGTEDTKKIQANMTALVNKRLVKQSLRDPTIFKVIAPDNTIIFSPREPRPFVTDARSFRLFRWLRGRDNQGMARAMEDRRKR